MRDDVELLAIAERADRAEIGRLRSEVGLGPTQESGQRHAQNFLDRSAWQGTVNGEERSRVARRLGDHLRGRIDHEQQPVLNGTRHVDGLAIADGQ